MILNMVSYSFVIFITLIVSLNGSKKHTSPPHCTVVTKDTDYSSRYKFSYPTVYLIPGQKEAYQQMFCLNPATVQKAVTTVCDWAAPPQVQFTLGDEYVHIVRQDPTGQYLGNAVVTTYQLCGHNNSQTTLKEQNDDEYLRPIVTDHVNA